MAPFRARDEWLRCPPRHKNLRLLRRGVTASQGQRPCADLRPAWTHYTLRINTRCLIAENRTIGDLTVLIDYILGSTVDIDLNAADVNEDGIINIADATELIDILLSIN